MTRTDIPVIIVGGGISGLACARHLHAQGIPVLVLEAGDRLGGRIRTDRVKGFRLDRGFQVLQTAYPEARRLLDYGRLELRTFAPGAIVRYRGRLYTLADPLRRPGALLDTISAPIGSLADRLRLLNLAWRSTRGTLETLFQQPESTAMEFLQNAGFSEAIIRRFFVPFFGGVCLDPGIGASSRVLQYVLRMFAAGDAALPAAGMEQIPLQLATGLPGDCVRTGLHVRQIHSDGVSLDDGTRIPALAVVAATQAPATSRLLGLPTGGGSLAETCLYFAAERADWHSAYLMLNGDGRGLINNIAIPSQVSARYAPVGESLIAVVLLGEPEISNEALVRKVRAELVDWFGREVNQWEHLTTYRISHALPIQSPPTENPYRPPSPPGPGIFVCGGARQPPWYPMGLAFRTVRGKGRQSIFGFGRRTQTGSLTRKCLSNAGKTGYMPPGRAEPVASASFAGG